MVSVRSGLCRGYCKALGSLALCYFLSTMLLSNTNNIQQQTKAHDKARFHKLIFMFRI